MNRFISITLACLALIGASLLAASPASAHTYTSTQGSDWAQVTHGYTCPTDGNVCYYRHVRVHDGECDGNASRVFYHVNNASATYNFQDDDGCGGNDTGLTLGSAYNVTSFRVCEAQPSGYVCGSLVSPSPHFSV